MKKLQTIFEERRDNNLNAIRLALALLVIFSHSFQLSLGNSVYEPLNLFSRGQAEFGSLAVDLFFFISGMLVTASWLRCRSMDDYLRKRILRIVPGYIVALWFSALVAGIFSPEHFSGFMSKLWWRSLLNDSVFLSFSSTEGMGFFPNNPFPHASNGSLWTIQLEFFCYLLVAVLGLFCLFKRRWLVLVIFLMVFLLHGRTVVRGGLHAGHTWQLCTFFFAGICTWLWRDKIPVNGGLALLAFVLVLIATQFPPFFSMLFPFAGGYLVLWLGFKPTIKALNWCNQTDLSYGAYLFAFPIQQCFASWPGARHPFIMFPIATLLTIGCAFLSWHFVESPFLRLKSRLFSDRDPAFSHKTEKPSAPASGQ